MTNGELLKLVEKQGARIDEIHWLVSRHRRMTFVGLTLVGFLVVGLGYGGWLVSPATRTARWPSRIQPRFPHRCVRHDALLSR